MFSFDSRVACFITTMNLEKLKNIHTNIYYLHNAYQITEFEGAVTLGLSPNLSLSKKRSNTFSLTGGP